MNEKVQDFRALSVLLIGNNAERPGKHLQGTAAFLLGPRFHIGLGAWGGFSP